MKIEKWEIENTLRWVLMLVSAFWISNYLRERVEAISPISTFWLGIIIIIAVMYFWKPSTKLFRVG